MKKLVSIMLVALIMLCIQPIKVTAAESIPDFIEVEVDTDVAGVSVENYEDYISFNDTFDYFKYADDGAVSAYCLTDNEYATIFEDGKEYLLTINVTGAEGYVMGAASTVACIFNGATPINYNAQEAIVDSETYYYFALTYHFAPPQRIMVDNVAIEIPVDLDGVSADDYTSFINLSSANVEFGSVPGEKSVCFYDNNDDVVSEINYSKEYNVYISLKPREGYKFPQEGAQIPCTINGKSVNGTVANNGLLEIYFEGYATLKSIVSADFEYANYKKGLATTGISATTQVKGISIEYVFLANYDGIVITDGSIAEGMDYVLLVYFKAEDGYIISELQEEGITVGGKEIREYVYDAGSKMGCFSYDLPVLVHEHSGGEATCVSRAKCSECFTEVFYGDLDPDNHVGDTEIKNKKAASCKEKGYTGDVYCLDCGNIAIAGEEIPKSTDHNYDAGVVTKQPTASEAGIKTFTCKECGATKTTSITVKKITPTIILSKTTFTYNGKVQKPTVTVKDGSSTLSSDKYTVTYASGCTNAGSYKVTVTLKGGYSGSATATYTIKPVDLSGFSATLKQYSFGYTEEYIKPVVTVKGKVNGSEVTLANWTDYKINYKNFKNAGTATMEIVGRNNYTGTITLTFTIRPIDLSKCSASLNQTSFTYTGEYIKPVVNVYATISGEKVALVNWKDYKATYSNFKVPGKATITLTGRGNYTGTITLTFTIKPKATSISSLTAGAKKLTVNWKAITEQVTGYEIQYATASSFGDAKTVAITNNTTASKVISGLTTGKTYYVRIRTYKTATIDGKATKVYSNWSAVKNVKVK